MNIRRLFCYFLTFQSVKGKRPFLHNKTRLNILFKRVCCGGRGWIRTIEAKSQQIYSLPPLATRELSPMSSCKEVCENCTLQANGAGERTRTPDLLITNQLLYQLSYTSAFARRPAQFPQLRPAQCRRWNQAACLLYRGPPGKSSGNSKKTRFFSLLCREERIREKTVDFFRFRATMGVWRNPPKKE